MILSVLVQDDQCADNARYPPAEGKEEHNDHRPAPAVDNGQRREKDGEEDAKEGHSIYKTKAPSSLAQHQLYSRL